jgi:hypothetical protein
MEHTDIARVCHEANRALQVIQGDPTIPVGPSWDDLDEETRRSAVSGVHGILDLGNTPEQSHAGWMDFKIANGWVYGPVKDDELKTHPLLVPYSRLSSAARSKDALFHNICHTLEYA